MTDDTGGPPEARHPIGVVSRRTGLKQDLIRAWERRYGAVEPSRSDTNRRFYSDADVERLHLLRQAVEAGRSIGQVAELPDNELRSLVEEDRAAGARVPPVPRPAPPAEDDRGEDGHRADHLLDTCIEAVRRLDSGGLEDALQRASVNLGRTSLLERVLVPLMDRIGEMWSEGELRPIHEHMATAAVRSLVGILQQSQPPVGASAPQLVVTTPTRQLHEVGALLAAATAAAQGWRVTYLGPNLPAEEIVAAVRQTGARAVALSVTYPPDDPQLDEELRRLRRLLDDRVPLLVGGRASAAYLEALEGARVHHGEDLKTLRRLLDRLRAG